MRDLIRLVKAWSAGERSQTWWLMVHVTPVDGHARDVRARDAKVTLWLELKPFVRHAIVSERSKNTHIQNAYRSTFHSLLARYEKKHDVRFRLDRAMVRASPPSLKKAVVAWLKNVRVDALPENTFEEIAAKRGATEKTIRSWLHTLSGNAGYELDVARVTKLVADDAFVAVARAWLERLVTVPPRASQVAFKRAAGAMCVLKRRGDEHSVAAAKKLLARASRTRQALDYERAFDSAGVRPA